MGMQVHIVTMHIVTMHIVCMHIVRMHIVRMDIVCMDMSHVCICAHMHAYVREECNRFFDLTPLISPAAGPWGLFS